MIICGSNANCHGFASREQARRLDGPLAEGVILFVGSGMMSGGDDGEHMVRISLKVPEARDLAGAFDGPEDLATNATYMEEFGE